MSYHVSVTRKSGGEEDFDENDNPRFPPITADELMRLAAADPRYVLHYDQAGAISSVEFPNGCGGTTAMLYNDYAGTLSFKIYGEWNRLLPAFRSLAGRLGGGASVRGEEGETY